MRDSTFPVPYRKGRPMSVIGAHCVLSYGEQTLLGVIQSIDYREGPPSGYFATVRHFNGEPWHITPNLGAIRLLDRSA